MNYHSVDLADDRSVAVCTPTIECNTLSSLVLRSIILWDQLDELNGAGTVQPVKIPAETDKESLLIRSTMLPFDSRAEDSSSGPRETILCTGLFSGSASRLNSSKRRAATSCLSGGCSWRCTSVVVAKPTPPKDNADRCRSKRAASSRALQLILDEHFAPHTPTCIHDYGSMLCELVHISNLCIPKPRHAILRAKLDVDERQSRRLEGVTPAPAHPRRA